MSIKDKRAASALGFVEKTLVGPIQCAGKTFGTSGALAASCEVYVPVVRWADCAAEHKSCVIQGTGTKVVRYGANGFFRTKLATGSILSSNSEFGDPAPGVLKKCEVGLE